MLNINSDINQQVLAGKILTGIVVDNNDPLYYGRIKVNIPSLYPQDLTSENLPWIESWQFHSSVNGQGNINIPDIGSKCRILFPSDDVYSGVYLTGIPNITGELLEDYPYTYGWIDRSGNLFMVNTEKNTCTFYHVSGTNIKVDGAGRTKIQVANAGEGTNPLGLTVEVVGDIDFKSTGKINFESKDMTIKVKNSIDSKCTKLTSTATADINISSNGTTNIGAGAAMNVMTKGVINCIGSQGNFGGSGSTFDGRPLSPYQTDVSHTPFMAFPPAGVPIPPQVETAKTPQIVRWQEPTPRERQAYQEGE